MEAITLDTYGKYHEDDDSYETLYFTVPNSWLAEKLTEWYDKECVLNDQQKVDNFQMNYDWDWTLQLYERAKKELYEVVEVCPDCMAENILLWDVDKYGYEATCKCGSPILLCDECTHSKDNSNNFCDWSKSGCFRKSL